MQLKAIIPIFVASAIGYVLQRDVDSVVTSISTITDQLATMNTTLDRIQGANDAEAAVDFQNQAMQLQTNLQTATDAAKTSPAFSDKDSSTVAYAVVGITDLTYAVLGKVALKRDVFDQLGGSAITDFVRDELQGLQNSTDGLSSALTDKFVKTVQDVAPLLVSSLDFHFYQTIKVYAK